MIRPSVLRSGDWRRDRKPSKRRLPDVPAPHRLTPDELAAEVARMDEFIWKIARRWWRTAPAGVDLDDVRAAAVGGLAYAARYRFDKREGVAFMSYAKAWADTAAQRYVRREAAGGFAVPVRSGLAVAVASLDAAFDDDGGTLGLFAGDPDPDPTFDFWEKVRRLLPGLDGSVVELKFRQGVSHREIARRLGLRDHKTVGGLMETALRRLRQHWGEAA